MRAVFSSILSLFLSVVFLLLATGLFNTFIGLRAAEEGYSQQVIGLMMSAFYGGLMLGSLRCASLINRVGHIRAFASFSSLSAAAVLMFDFLPYAWAWIGLRIILGFNLAGMYMVTESWLNNRATSETRGTLLSVYMMMSFLAMGGGQFLLNLGDISDLTGYVLAALLLSMAVVPVALTRATYPPPVDNPHLPIRELIRISPLAVTTCFVSGLTLGAAYGMGPVFARELGLPTSEIAMFMGVMIIAGLFFQLPIGRLSDRYDRRWVITWVAIAAAAASLLMVGLIQFYTLTAQGPGGDLYSSVWLPHSNTVLLVIGLFGGIIATLYPLSIAYANDYLTPDQLVPAAGGMVLAYSVGAVIGPTASAWLMQLIGGWGLFVFTAASAAGLVVFSLYRMRRRAWAPVMEKEAFVALPDALTTPTGADIDPRGEETLASAGGPYWLQIVDHWHRARSEATPAAADAANLAPETDVAIAQRS